MTGFRHDELIGMNGFELVAPEVLDTVLEHIRRGRGSGYEVLGVRKGGCATTSRSAEGTHITTVVSEGSSSFAT